MWRHPGRRNVRRRVPGGRLGMAIIRRVSCMIDRVFGPTLAETKWKPRFPGRDGLPGLGMALAAVKSNVESARSLNFLDLSRATDSLQADGPRVGQDAECAIASFMQSSSQGRGRGQVDTDM